MARGGEREKKYSSGRPNPVDIHVGARVRLRRTLLGMSQEKLGDAIGLTFQQVQKYERGANRIGASRLFHLSKVLDVPVSFFFEDMPSPGAGKGAGHAAGHGMAEEKGGYEADPMARRETLERYVKRMEELERRMETLEKRMVSGEERSGFVEQTVAALKEDVRALRVAIDFAGGKLDALEARIDAADQRNETQHQELFRRFTGVEGDLKAFVKVVNDVVLHYADEMDTLRNRMALVENQVGISYSSE